MTTWPRALCGPVLGMARPRRPFNEIGAVQEAANLLRRELGPISAKAISRIVASRVVQLMLDDIEQSDPLVAALTAIEQRYSPSPFLTLATCPEIDTAAQFVSRRVGRLQARSGRYLTPAGQTREREEIADETRMHLAERYARHLRQSVKLRFSDV